MESPGGGGGGGIVAQRAEALRRVEARVARAITRLAAHGDPTVDMPGAPGLCAQAGGAGGAAGGTAAFTGARDYASTLRMLSTAHQLVGGRQTS